MQIIISVHFNSGIEKRKKLSQGDQLRKGTSARAHPGNDNVEAQIGGKNVNINSYYTYVLVR